MATAAPSPFSTPWTRFFQRPLRLSLIPDTVPLCQRAERELSWLVCGLPTSQQREQITRSLRSTLRFRASEGGATLSQDEPEQPQDRQRFGLEGEALLEVSVWEVRKRVRQEVRATLRTLEGRQSWSERNWRLAMHSARLGQLYANLLWRDEAALAELRAALTLTWG